MIAVQIRFTAGQYHATPWGHHVNEGEVEWPPSPWRILRALIAVWYRKTDDKQHSLRLLGGLIEKLASTLPVYQLPPAIHTHTRHYMPTVKDDTALVFDAFARVSARDVLVVGWPEILLTNDEYNLLSHLVESLHYLGRAESWVEAAIIPEWSGLINCFPAQGQETPRSEMHLVSVACPQTIVEFSEWRSTFNGEKVKKGWLPSTLTEALSVDTADLQKSTWNIAPGMKNVVYARPEHHLVQEMIQRQKTKEPEYNVARFALGGKPLPKWINALMMGELLHLALMGHGGEDVPSTISGRDADHHVLKAGHRHGFFLPEDVDGDGFIDHLLFVSKDPFPNSVVAAIERIGVRGKLWTPEHWPGQTQRWTIYLEHLGNIKELGGRSGNPISLLGRSTIWRSCTPYLFPWHAKKGGRFGPDEQIVKEILQRGLPEPISVKHVSQIPVGTRVQRVIGESADITVERFRRRRIGRPDQHAPDAYGSFLVLHFPEPVSGPMAFGFACHYGLGMFVPMQEDSALTIHMNL